MNNDPLGPKDPEEIKVIRFPFERELAGAAIVNVDYVTPTTFKGTDATPASVILGLPVVSGTDVLQRMQAGQHLATYKFRCKVTDTNGNKHIVTNLVAVKTELA